MRSLTLACFLVATGCVSTNQGRPFDATHIPDIKPGMDKAAITAWFGEAFREEDMDGPCTERWVYYSAPAKLLFVQFDDKGKVCSY
jgi:hypothetical protein